ncbi:MAG: hypothetical protein WA691_03345 [Thermoplasmata archaeon]
MAGESASTPEVRRGPAAAGVPPGIVSELVSCLKATSGPLRRRPLLAELERRGHRISLAGLNRALQQCRDSGLTTEGPDGVQLRS